MSKPKKTISRIIKDCIDEVSEDVVHKDGRKPFDKSELRVADESVHGAVQNPPPTGYQSIQKYINSGPGKTLVVSKLNEYLKKLLQRGWVRVKNNDLYSLNPGNRVAYITTDNKWRSGGFVVSVKDSFTKYGEDPNKKEEDENTVYKPYLLYKAFNGALFSLQEEDIDELWTKNKKIPKEKDNRAIFKLPGEETEYAVVLENDYEEDVVVYYARDEYVRKRFMNTSKFDRALDYGWAFNDGTQGTPIKEDNIQLIFNDDFSDSDSD